MGTRPVPHDHDHQSYVPLAFSGPEAKASAINRKMRYVSLHHHSTFSFQDGFQQPERHIERAAELGMGALALTEHGNVSSHVKLEIAANKTGVQPIFGCEVYAGGVGEAKTQRKNHLTLLAADQNGYRNLLRTVTQGWSDFYYEPTVSGANLAEHKDGLVVLSGCTGSLLATSLVGGKNVPEADASFERGLAVARQFKKVFGDAYYLEVQMFPELENVRRINAMMVEISQKLKIPMVATGDVHYTTPDENEMQMILHSVGRNRTLEQLAQGWGYDVPLSPAVGDRDVLARLQATGLTPKQARAALLTTEEIADRCKVVLPKLPELKYPLPKGCNSAFELWEAWIREGWYYRGCDKLPRDERRRYKDRIAYERNQIENKNFIDYFLIVADMVKWTKDNGILVGPARGSAAASLICWLLRITEVDPLRFDNLVFERFIDVSRADLPDVDLDFDSERRDEVRHYMARKYGVESVGNIGTFTYYKAKLALDDVARVHRIPRTAVDVVKEHLVERSSGDLRADATVQDTVEQFPAAQAVFEQYPELYKAMDLEGNIKGMGVHAAGLVIANGPLTEVCAMYEREVSGKIYQVVSLDKYDAERQNLLKIDALGLSTMTLIAECLEWAGLTIEDLYALNFDDEEVIDAFRRNDTVGIFQFDGRAMRQVTREVKPDTFAEICDINALARPGPLYGGATGQYIRAKWEGNVDALHPLVGEICKGTHGQIVYQEQILRIVTEIGNFDWTHASYIRKIISKKLGKQEFERQYNSFLEGASTHGVPEATSRQIWNAITTAGAYAFNAAHCVSYGILAYWTMWMKVKHSQIFYAAALNHLNEKKTLDLLQDAERHGIRILPPDVVNSQKHWVASHRKPAIMGGLTVIPGIAEKTANAIIEARDDGWTWEDITKIKGIGDAKLKMCLDFVAKEDPYDIHLLEREIRTVKEQLWRYGVPQPTHQSVDVPYSKGKDTRVIWIGKLKYRNQKNLFEAHFSRTGEELDPAEVKDPELAEWVTGMGYDPTDVLTLSWNRWLYPKLKDDIFDIALDKDLVVVEGVKKGFSDRRSISVRKMWVFEP